QTETTKFRPVLAISPTGRKLLAGEFPLELTTLMPGDLVEALSLKFQGKIPRRNAPAATTTKELEPIAIPQETTTSDSPSGPATTPDLFESVEPQPEASAKKQTHAVESTSSSQSKVPSEKGEQVQPDLSKLRLDRPEPHSVQPNFFWTWRLLADGYSMDHLRQVRQIDEETIFSHVLRATENNLPVQAEWLLSDEKIATLNKLISQHPSDRTSKLISKLPSDCLPQELVYFLKCQTAS
ncbi:MAG: hypothetical protein GY748_14510, partial [Planctomycetaceae bacterium]|nr:hypothetical protein [Planctomycetaceae bacterium]